MRCCPYAAPTPGLHDADADRPDDTEPVGGVEHHPVPRLEEGCLRQSRPRICFRSLSGWSRQGSHRARRSALDLQSRWQDSMPFLAIGEHNLCTRREHRAHLNSKRLRPGTIARLYPSTAVHIYSQPVTRVHTRSQVELILASLNTPPQVDGLLGHLSRPFSGAHEASGPAWRSASDGGYTFEDASNRAPRPLHRRLSPENRAALVAAFVSGVKQRELAIQYGISIRSVKRLVRAARESAPIG
jgi:hypothetical protein